MPFLGIRQAVFRSWQNNALPARLQPLHKLLHPQSPDADAIQFRITPLAFKCSCCLALLKIAFPRRPRSQPRIALPHSASRFQVARACFAPLKSASPRRPLSQPRIALSHYQPCFTSLHSALSTLPSLLSPLLCPSPCPISQRLAHGPVTQIAPFQYGLPQLKIASECSTHTPVTFLSVVYRTMCSL